MFLKVFNLLHDLTKYFRTVLWGISIFNQAYFDIKFQLVANILVVQPIRKRRLCIDDFFYLFRQCPALLIDRNTIDFSVGAVFKMILIS